jgi:hypothetical protein
MPAKKKPAAKAKKVGPKGRPASANLIPGNPGNSGGKKGRSGRKSEDYKAWFRDLMTDPKARQNIRDALCRKGANLHRNYPVILKTALGYAYGTPVQTIDVQERPVIARFPEPVASEEEWLETYAAMLHGPRRETPN